jgi:hypothetical protein
VFAVVLLLCSALPLLRCSPVYCNQPGFIIYANSTGYECEGQSVNGKLKYKTAFDEIT